MKEVIDEFVNNTSYLTDLEINAQSSLNQCYESHEFIRSYSLEFLLNDLALLSKYICPQLPYNDKHKNYIFETSKPVIELKRDILFLENILRHFAYQYGIDYRLYYHAD